MRILSFVNFLPTRVNPDENDITLKIYSKLKNSGRFSFTILKSINLSPLALRLFNKRFSIYHALKRSKGIYNDKFATYIHIYEFPDFKEPMKVKVKLVRLYYWLFLRTRIASLEMKSFDVIHSNAIYPDLLIGDIVSTTYKIPHKCTLRGKPAVIKQNFSILKDYLIRAELSTPNFEIFEFLRNMDIQIRYIPHGIETAFFNEPAMTSNKAKEEMCLNFLTVARLLKLKNIDESIKLIHSLKIHGYRVHYDIIGSGEQEKELKALVNSLKLNNEVVFHGRKESDFIIDKYRTANFFILLSERETFGLSFVEAMASGCLLIAKPKIGVTAYFEDAPFVLKYENPENTLISIAKILEDDLYDIYSMASYKASLQFSFKNMIDNYTEYLEN